MLDPEVSREIGCTLGIDKDSYEYQSLVRHAEETVAQRHLDEELQRKYAQEDEVETVSIDDTDYEGLKRLCDYGEVIDEKFEMLKNKLEMKLEQAKKDIDNLIELNRELEKMKIVNNYLKKYLEKIEAEEIQENYYDYQENEKPISKHKMEAPCM